MNQASWVGQTLGGRYKIEDLLGRGGMSAVYKATDPNLRRVVAIKLILPHLSDNPDFVRRFEEEATAVAQLRHPNIVQVFDFNHDGGGAGAGTEAVYYMVMEFIPGETLQERLRRLNSQKRTLPLVDVVRFAINLCDALDYAHQRGMIHRDIKPANIMLDVYGQAILMDFGIAKLLGGQQHTATGAVIGTAMYMSPEQIQGERPDVRSDLYSLGITLFEMVSGRPPFEAESAMTLMMMHLNDPVPDLHELKPGVPDDLIGIIQKALAKKRTERFQSTAEMGAALHRVRTRLEGAAPAGTTMIEPPEGRKPDPSTAPGIPGSQTALPNAEITAQPISPQSTYVEPPYASAAANPGVPGMSAAATPPSYNPPSSTFVEGPASGVGAPTGGSIPPSGTAAGPGSTAGYPAPARRNLKPLLIGGGVVLVLGLVCLVGGGLALFNRFYPGGSLTGALASPSNTPPSLAGLVDSAQSTQQPDVIAAPTETPAPPTWTPTVTLTSPPYLTPTETLPPGPYARITNIAVDQNRYVVDYETFEFTEKISNNTLHVHFFYDTVQPEQAGVPGSGPWILYGGPRPFSGYTLSSRPEGATQMCILVANPDHSVQANTGNCMILPDY